MHFSLHGVLVLLIVCVAFGALLWTALAGLIAWGILHPPRMSAGKAIYHLQRLSPGDLGLEFEEQSFFVQHAGEKLHITGWWIPAQAPSEKCAVLIHGYADAKVGAIAFAPLLHDLNLNILAIDLRAHGDSGGKFCTGGFFERQDLSQVIDQLLNLHPDQSRQLILFGISLGAAVAAAVAVDRGDIAAVILESPYTDYKKAVTTQIRMMGLPDWLIRPAIAGSEWISGAHFDAVRPIDLLAKIKCPVLAIVGSEDELLDPADIDLFEKSIGPSSAFWRVEGAGHLQAMGMGPIEYERRIGEFLANLRW